MRITKTEHLTGLMHTILSHAEGKHFLISFCQSFIKNRAQTVHFLIDFLTMVTQAFVLSQCVVEQRIVEQAPAGCNLSRAAVCGNYLLHGSAVGNRYLYPGCQTVGFPPLTLSDIR